MRIPAQVKPGLIGALGGAIAMAVIGFSWGGWVTGGTADKIADARSNVAVVQALTPYCLAQAKAEPEQLKLLKAADTYRRSGFVQEKTSWVAGMDQKYRYDVAVGCASKAVEAMEAAAKG